MLYSGTDPEPFIIECTFVFEDSNLEGGWGSISRVRICQCFLRPSVANAVGLNTLNLGPSSVIADRLLFFFFIINLQPLET